MKMHVDRAGDRVDRRLNGVAETAPRDGEKHAHHDHSEDERVLHERLALLVAYTREQKINQGH